MATSAKTTKLTKTPLPATPKAAPRTRTKANLAAAVAEKPQSLKSKAVVKKPADAVSRTKPAKVKAAAKETPAVLPISAEHRRHYIELAAFYIAERRGFSGGNSLQAWLQAEAEIDQLLQQGKINR